MRYLKMLGLAVAATASLMAILGGQWRLGDRPL
jgi:hypothetical protein